METFAPRGKVYGPILPQFALDAPITSGAKIMYALLCNYASDSDHCWPSHATLATKLSCSVSSVKKYLAELVGTKLISVRHEQYRSCVYYMLRPDALKDMEAKTVRPQPVNDHAQSKIGCLNTLNKQKEENTLSPLPPIPVSRSLPPASGPVGGGGFSFHDFDKAWEAYPKKEAMVLARRAWNRLRHNGQLPPLSDLLAAIKRFTFADSWQREHGRYIPQMSNWLRGQRWLDVFSGEDEDAARQRQEAERLALARKREEEAREAACNAERERLLPIYEAFKAKFPAETLSVGQEAMLHGTWSHFHSKYGGPLAADVPDDNALCGYDFLKAYRRRREAEACHTARFAHDSQDNRERKPMNSAGMPQPRDSLARLLPAA